MPAEFKMAGAAKEGDSTSAYPPFVLGKPRFDQVEARRGEGLLTYKNILSIALAPNFALGQLQLT